MNNNNNISNAFCCQCTCLGIAADHGGLEKKQLLIEHLRTRGFTVRDFGPACFDAEDDYPDFAAAMSQALVHGQINAGILICRSGIGMSIAANRFARVRAALVEDESKARLSRSHNNANVLVTGGDAMSDATLLKVVDTWLDEPFSAAERHARRVAKLDSICGDAIAAVRSVDPQIAALLDQEQQRQDQGLELIASENFASAAVQAATGSLLTNKYAEGYPGKRYYNGCEFVDDVERLAIARACELFGAESANVQAHSGSQANMAAYFALLEPGDTVLAMSLAHGGHLSHGLGINFSGRFFRFVEYGVDRQSEQLDYDAIAAAARQHQPKMLVAGASAYSRQIDFARLRAIADDVGAYLMIDMAHIAGLVAAGLHPNPVPDAHVVTSTTHKTLRGPRGGLILSTAAIARKINSQIFPGIQGGPLMHVIAGKAICLHEALQPQFRCYQQQVIANAQALAGALQQQPGLRIVSGGTDNHLMLVDLRGKHLSGKVAATALDAAGITVNKNLIPYDPEPATVTSGLRLGTPAVTTRGMGEAQMQQIAAWIGQVLDNVDDAQVAAAVRRDIFALTRQFPLPRLQP